MEDLHFVKVFDVLDSGFKSWYFPAGGLIFIGIGSILLLSEKIIRAWRSWLSRAKTSLLTLWLESFEFRPAPRLVGYLFIGFASIWTISVLISTCSEHLRHRSLLARNSCRMVEGPVEQFKPMPYSGHAMETFAVRGIVFRYSNFEVTDAFNNTASHGGPISERSYVRICYDPSGNAILRLEIRVP